MLIPINRARIGNSGLTLVEVIIAMALVAIVVTMIFPVVFFAEKRMMENRNRMAAKAISQKQLEAIRSTVTVNNYFDSLPAGDYGPVLVASGATLTVSPYDGSSDGNPVSADGTLSYSGSGQKYYVKTTIGWMDDPADGTEEGVGSNHDDMPFDYKELVIRVATNSLFTDEQVIRGDFKTLLAMEGGEEPYSGLAVKVVHGWPSGVTDQDRDPIFGAAIRLSPTAPTGPTDSSPWNSVMSYTTNSKGEALIPIDPDGFGGANTKDFWIQVVYSGFIEDPAQVRDVDWRKVTVTRFVTSTVYRRIEEPCSLNLNFNGQQLADAIPVWDGANQNWNVKLEPADNLPPGDDGLRMLAPGQTSLSFENLWPAGTASQYTVTANLKAWEEQFNAPGDWSTWAADRSRMDPDGTVYYNLWNYSSGAWYASTAGDPRQRTVPAATEPAWSWFGSGENRLLSNANPAVNYIPLSRFAPVDVPVAGQSPLNGMRGIMLSWDQYLTNFSSPGDFTVLYAGLAPPDDAGPDNSGSTSLGPLWRPVADLATLLSASNTSVNHKEIKMDNINGVNIDNMFADNYRLRFDSNPGISAFALDNLLIRCQYEKSFYFGGPGQALDYTVTAD